MKRNKAYVLRYFRYSLWFLKSLTMRFLVCLADFAVCIFLPPLKAAMTTSKNNESLSVKRSKNFNTTNEQRSSLLRYV